MQHSNAEVESLGSFSYVSFLVSVQSILLSYCSVSRMTVQLPLSADTMTSDVSDLICLWTVASSGCKLLAVGLALANTPTI